MRTDRKQLSLPAAGESSLLVILAVLCLVTFAVLTLSTVQASGRLSRKSAEAVTAYYAADTQAEKILTGIRHGEVPADVSVSGNQYTYTVPISDTQELQVEVQVSSVNDYQVMKWQTVSGADWTPDEHLDVWDGNSGDEGGT